MVALTQTILDEIADYIANQLTSHLTVGTGDNAITLASTDLETPVQIGVADRNKSAESVTVTDNFFSKEYILTTGEPDTQPVNIGEVGIQPGADTTDELKVGFVFTASTKDTDSKWTIRLSGKVIEET